MKRLIGFLEIISLIVSVVFSVPLSAGADFYCGDFRYIVLSDGTASITGYLGSEKELTVPGEIDGYSVSDIGEYAFCGCNDITELTIPDGVKSISGWAFYRCENLAGVAIPEGVTCIGEYAFCDCIGLESVVIPGGVTDIGVAAFNNCTGLTGITVPQSVTAIGVYAFYGCDSLTVYGQEGSYAQSYANENGIPFSLILEPIEKKGVFVFKLDNENVYYVDENITFQAGSTPVLDDEKRTVVPLRAISAAAGISDLKYDDVTKKITFTGVDGYSVEMQIGSDVCKLTKDSEVTEITIAQPFTKDGSAMLPLRDTANLVGGYVKYYEGYIIVSKNEINDADTANYIAAYNAQ